MRRLLILDFDGTMTDAEREGAPFRAEYLADLAILTGRSSEEVEEMAQRFEAEVAAQQSAYGWVYDNHIVAPAGVDPYLRIMPVARKILDACGVFKDEQDRTRLLDGILYKYNYPKTDIAFRPGAREVLLQLAGTATHVVTNSHTDPVRQKIRVLSGEDGALDWLVDRVHGSAKKYAIDSDFDRVEPSFQLPGLERPVLLRRRLYFEIMDGLRSELAIDWNEVLVVGDVFELDLALPLALGAHGALVVNEFTPAYETEFLAAHPRGRILADLSEIPPLLLDRG